MANDYSWIEPLAKNASNIFGLNPEEKAKGALVQQQREASAADTELTRARTGLIPLTAEEIRARTAGHNAKTKLDTDLSSANSRLAAALSKGVYTDERGETFFDPSALKDIVTEFPHLKVDLEKLAKGLGQLNLNARSRQPAAPAATPPAPITPLPGTAIQEITPQAAPQAAPAEIGGLSTLMAPQAGQPESVDDMLARFRREDANPAPSPIQQIDMTGLAGVLSSPTKPDRIPDDIMRERLARTGKVLNVNQALSDEGATAIRTENTDNAIRVNAAKPVTLGVGQQAYGQDGKPIAENTMARTLAGGASMVDKDGNIIVTAPKVGGTGGKGTGTGAGGTAGGGEAPGTLDVNRSNEWIARAKEVVAEWSESTEGNPISPGVASQLAAHAYKEYFGQGMPSRNADEVMREYLAKSGLKVDNTVGNWNPFNSNKTEISTRDGKVVTGGKDSPIVANMPDGSPSGTAAINPKALREGGPLPMPSPDSSSVKTPHYLGTKKPGGGVWTLEDMKPGMVYMGLNAEDRNYHLYQMQADGRSLTLDDATDRGNIAYMMHDLETAGFTVFGRDMPKNQKFSENGQVKEYGELEPVNVRHLLSRPTGLGIAEWGITNRIGTFGQLQNMMRYIARTETGDESFRGLQNSPTLKAYYLEKDPNKKMDILQEWLNNKVAPVREFYQREKDEASKAQKPESLASNLSSASK